MITRLDGHSYKDEGTHVAQNVTIGRYCSIANLCTIGAQRHDYTKFTNYAFADEDDRKTDIGHDVWIGANSVVLSGVTIGIGAIIGAGSVVACDVPPYAIAYGVPARVHKYRFPHFVIARLLESKWWELPIEIISELPPEPMAAIEALAKMEFTDETDSIGPQSNSGI